MSIQSTSNIIEILKNHKSKEGIQLFYHLCELFNKLSLDKTNLKDFENFEVLSELVKQNHFLYKDPKNDFEVNQIIEHKSEYSEWIAKSKELLKISNSRNKSYGAISNFVYDSKLFEQAGVYFGEEETYRIQKSIIQLAQQVKAKELRFWGKILGTNKDYYIAEGILDYQNSDEIPPQQEQKGFGCNRLTFWVTENVLEEWIELPLVTPEQIKTSRLIRHLFTGNLNAPVNSYPKFNGLEKHLLKAQIVRITFSSVIVPKGLYKTQDEAADQIEFEEEFKLPEFPDLSNTENWVHLNPQILRQGRITHFIDPSLNEEEKAILQEQLAEQDPIIDRLKGINEDRPFEAGEPETPNWLVKTVGESQVFNQVGKDEGTTTSYGVVVFKNMTWPGTITVANAKGFSNLYVGYGLKEKQSPIYPLMPNDCGEDPEDQEEQQEPNPKNPINELEPDSDHEGKNKEDGGDEDAD